MKNTRFIPYSRQSIADEDIAAVVSVLRSDYLTTGPRVEEFEHAVAALVGTGEAVAVSSGTAALHTAMACLGVGPGDEVVVPAMTFAGTANAALLCGATPVFADVDPSTLLVDPDSVRRGITSRTKLIVAVDYAGQPCDYDRLRVIARECGVRLLADACHSLGASLRGRPVGGLADATVFSFHPVKPITSGEGGMIATDDEPLARHMRRFRNHGIDLDFRQRRSRRDWRYEVVDAGCNYRLSDLHCALGLSQLARCRSGMERRNQVARRYRLGLDGIEGVRPLAVRPDATHAYHLFVVRVVFERRGPTRTEVFRSLHDRGVGANVHYLPVHLHPLYRRRFGTGPGLCPEAERAYEELLSLPIFAAITDAEVERVLAALVESVSGPGTERAKTRKPASR